MSCTRVGVSWSESTMPPGMRWVPKVALNQSTPLRTAPGSARTSSPSWSTSSAPNRPRNPSSRTTSPRRTSPVAAPRRIPRRASAATIGSTLMANSQERKISPRKPRRFAKAHSSTWNSAMAERTRTTPCRNQGGASPHLSPSGGCGAGTFTSGGGSRSRFVRSPFVRSPFAEGGRDHHRGARSAPTPRARRVAGSVMVPPFHRPSPRTLDGPAPGSQAAGPAGWAAPAAAPALSSARQQPSQDALGGRAGAIRLHQPGAADDVGAGEHRDGELGDALPPLPRGDPLRGAVRGDRRVLHLDRLAVRVGLLGQPPDPAARVGRIAGGGRAGDGDAGLQRPDAREPLLQGHPPAAHLGQPQSGQQRGRDPGPLGGGEPPPGGAGHPDPVDPLGQVAAGLVHPGHAHHRPAEPQRRPEVVHRLRDDVVVRVAHALPRSAIGGLVRHRRGYPAAPGGQTAPAGAREITSGWWSPRVGGSNHQPVVIMRTPLRAGAPR